MVRFGEAWFDMERAIENESDRRLLHRYIDGRKLPFVVQFLDGRHRSLDQNRLYHMWATEAAVQRPGMTMTDILSEWKLNIAVPLLLAENDDFAAAWATADDLPYERKLKMMPMIHVTSQSFMSVTLMKRYMDEIQHVCAENGIELTDPEALRYGTR